MSRHLVLVAAMLLAGVIAPDPARARAQQPIFRARTDVVSVAVSVMKGREPVLGLGAADFEITDNGVRQTVDAVASDRLPVDLTLVMTGFAVDRAIERGRGLVSAEATRQLLQPSDRLRIVWVYDDVSGGLAGVDYSVPTDPAARQAAGVAHLNGFTIWSDQAGKRLTHGIALADGLFYALAWPVDPDRRHLVVAFTDGFDTASTIEMETLPKLAGHSDAVLHAVFWATPSDGPGSAGGLSTWPPASILPAWEESYRLVDAAVRRTGGTIHLAKQAPNALADIIAEFRSSYILRYTPRGVAPAGWHELGVKVTRPGSFKVRARKGYEGG